MKVNFMRNCFIIAIVAFAFRLDAHAEIASALSVEWLTCASDVVVVGKIISVKNTKGPGQVIYADCVLSVAELIKGPPAQEVSFCYRYLSDGFTWTPPKTDLLVCLFRYKTPYDEARLQLYTDPYYEARLHNLLMPTTNNYPFSIIELSSPERYVFDGQLKRLTTGDSILQVARSAESALASRRDSEPTFQLKPRRIWLDPDSEVSMTLYAGSACFIQVPEFMFPEPTK